MLSPCLWKLTTAHIIEQGHKRINRKISNSQPWKQCDWRCSSPYSLKSMQEIVGPVLVTHRRVGGRRGGGKKQEGKTN